MDTKNLEKQPLLEGKEDLRLHLYTMEEHSSKIRIHRNVYMQNPQSISRDDADQNPFSLNCKPKKFIKSMFPAITWLCTYQWKEWLVKDLIAGATVAIMNVPQGMAYALLGNVPPVVGIYMALFPVLVYALLGTSKHISMGSFAVVCLMAGNVVTKFATPEEPMRPGNLTILADADFPVHYTPIQVASAVAFLVGIYQLIMYLFRFGILCTLLSETLVSGFTAGAAIHVLTSQLKDVFGIKIGQFNGPLKLIRIYGDLFSKLHTTNLAAVVASAITVVILIANNEFLKPVAAKRCIVPVPIELIVVMCGTLASTYGNLATVYSLKVVGDIPVGLPEPTLPPFDLLPSIAVDSLIIAIIAYAISLSMALIFANKLKYEIDPNQELIAQGCGNVVGSLFSCLPIAASLSRSAIQQSVGGCTQLTSIFSAVILTGVLLWIAPFFELLPRCVLASLIIVALKGILFQATDIIKIWRISSLEAIIWVTTYLSVIIIDIDYGLLAGIATSVIILFVRGAQLQVVELERLRNTEIYVQSDKYLKTERISGVMVVSYTGCINFVNSMTFKKQTMEIVLGSPESPSSSKVSPQEGQYRETIVMDFRCISYIDSSGAKSLKFIMDELCNHNKNVLLVGLSAPSILMLRSCNVTTPSSEPIFPTVQDAVSYAQSNHANNVYTIRL